jgi:hypothetical protein
MTFKHPVPFVLASLVALACTTNMSPVLAGTKLIRAEGRASIAGGNIQAARKAALAEALYDAAGQVRMVVRGASYLSSAGTIKEDTGIAVEGLLKGYQVVDERKEGNRYLVSIEALADTDDSECTSRKRADIAIAPISVQVAPGLSGAEERMAHESLEHFLGDLKASDSWRITDDRNLYGASSSGTGAPKVDRYAALLKGYATSAAGFTLSGQVVIERNRSDTLALNKTDLVATATLKLTDNYTGGTVETIREKSKIQIANRLWGTEIDISEENAPSTLDPLWSAVEARLEDRLGCQPLRAVITSVNADRATLSVGSEQGVKAGDYFLVEFMANSQNAWQLMRVEQASPTTSSARFMKATTGIRVNALATLLQ